MVILKIDDFESKSKMAVHSRFYVHTETEKVLDNTILFNVRSRGKRGDLPLTAEHRS